MRTELSFPRPIYANGAAVKYTCSVECELLQDVAAFEALKPEWDALHAEVRAGLFVDHRWIGGYFRARHTGDRLWTFVVREGSFLRAAWALALRAPQSGALSAGELRLIGDPGAQIDSLLCAPEVEESAATAIGKLLSSEKGWDHLRAPLSARRFSRALEQTLTGEGARAELLQAWGRSLAQLGSRAVDVGGQYRIAEDFPAALQTLERLCRRELGDSAIDAGTAQFLRETVSLHAKEGRARIGLLYRASQTGDPIAADLVCIDRRRHVQLLSGADPERAGAVSALTAASVTVSAEQGAERFVLLAEDSPLRTAAEPFDSFRAWNRTARGRMHRGFSSIKDAMRTAGKIRDAAPMVARNAVAKMASYTTLHLYRGELFVRTMPAPVGFTLSLFDRAAFEALSGSERAELIERLDLQESYCRQKWSRGDMVVLAQRSVGPAGQKPAGIVWCARAPVFVPDIGREVRPVLGEGYIHDVFVAPEERGQKVAPAMLDFLARELRSRDVYRAWALIERSNTASTRAFEKAAYASVGDVIYAKVGLASHLVVRPPDPEARAFLGL